MLRWKWVSRPIRGIPIILFCVVLFPTVCTSQSVTHFSFIQGLDQVFWTDLDGAPLERNDLSSSPVSVSDGVKVGGLFGQPLWGDRAGEVAFPDSIEDSCLYVSAEMVQGGSPEGARGVWETTPTPTPTPSPTLDVVFPNGGQTWESGSKHKIVYSAPDSPSVTLEFSTDSGDSWRPVASDLPASCTRCSYAWDVPEDASSSLCLVRVADPASGLSDVSDDHFTITPYPNPFFTHEQLLTATDPQANDMFGASVALSGHVAVVGAPRDDLAGIDSGSVHVFAMSRSKWAHQQTLVADDAEGWEEFGSAVTSAGNGNIIFAGAPNATSGAVYVFRRNNSAWSQQAKLTARGVIEHGRFGCSVSISGDGHTLVVGASQDFDGGSAYIFKWSGSWTTRAKLTVPAGGSHGRFGASVSISEDGHTVAVGAPNESGRGFLSGAVHIFSLNGSNWRRQASLAAPAVGSYAAFGSSVSISGDTVIVGAPSYETTTEFGSAYVFVREDETWRLQQELMADDTVAYIPSAFGSSVSIDEDTAVVGGQEQEDWRGAVYSFLRREDRWIPTNKLTPAGAHPGLGYGSSVAVSGDSVIVGIDRKFGSEDALSPGLAYVYQHADPNGPLYGDNINTPDNFPDPNFRAAVEQIMDVEPGGPFTAAQAEAMTEDFRLSARGITSLQGLEYFPNITSLDCSSNALTELDISNMPRLDLLNCSVNALTSLVISNNPVLRVAVCAVNNLDSLDITNNDALIHLSVHHNDLGCDDWEEVLTLLEQVGPDSFYYSPQGSYDPYDCASIASQDLANHDFFFIGGTDAGSDVNVDASLPIGGASMTDGRGTLVDAAAGDTVSLYMHEIPADGLVRVSATYYVENASPAPTVGIAAIGRDVLVGTSQNTAYSILQGPPEVATGMFRRITALFQCPDSGGIIPVLQVAGPGTVFFDDVRVSWTSDRQETTSYRLISSPLLGGDGSTVEGNMDGGLAGFRQNLNSQAHNEARVSTASHGDGGSPGQSIRLEAGVDGTLSNITCGVDASRPVTLRTQCYVQRAVGASGFFALVVSAIGADGSLSTFGTFVDAGDIPGSDDWLLVQTEGVVADGAAGILVTAQAAGGDLRIDVDDLAVFRVISGEPGETIVIDLPGLPRDAKQLEMVAIAPGTFTMGSPDNEPDRHADEGPQHEVTLTQAFYLGKYEVTQAQWEAVMGVNPSRFNYSQDRPVDSVSWDECQDLILALNGLGQGTFRLPTEAEWEYAYRAGIATRFYWGDDLGASMIGDYAWYGGNALFRTQDVGQKLPNRWGLFDLSGNVYEWCGDWFYAGYYGISETDDPQGLLSGPGRVIRGGSWFNQPQFCRAAYRHYFPSGNRDSYIGLRLARSYP